LPRPPLHGHANQVTPVGEMMVFQYLIAGDAEEPGKHELVEEPVW
jgi:hypothetical protein